VCYKYAKGGNELTIYERSNLKKYRNRLIALVNLKVSFQSKRKLIVQNGGLIVPNLTFVLSYVIGSLLNNF